MAPWRIASCFNEAPAFLPGNRAHERRQGGKPSFASMRPRHFYRGIAVEAFRDSIGLARFNEAPAFLPGNS